MCRRTIVSLVSVALVIATFLFVSNSPAQPPRRVVIEPPPKSLDKLYPPQAKGPVLLIEMIKLVQLFTSTRHDVLQRDWDNAQHGFASFKEQISKLSRMVPEWKHDFKMDLVEELGRAIAQKNVQAIMKVHNEKIVPMICEECHRKHRLSVWYRYHWTDFGKIMVKDPISGKELRFFDFKLGLDESFNGIGLDVQQRQPDRAKKTFKAFTARVETLKIICYECHDRERKYYISPDVMGMIAELGAEISKPKPDPNKLEALFMGIGIKMCYGCHQVHWPAGMVQSVLRGPQD